MLLAQALEIKEKKKIDCTWLELDIEGLLIIISTQWCGEGQGRGVTYQENILLTLI